MFSSDTAAWERMKLRMLNGAHSALAYRGRLKGHETVDAAIADREIATLVEGLWRLARIWPRSPDTCPGVPACSRLGALQKLFGLPGISMPLPRISPSLSMTMDGPSILMSKQRSGLSPYLKHMAPSSVRHVPA